MTTTTPDLDTITTVSTEFHPDQYCAHSDHTNPGWAHLHAGPATHYAQVTHDCPNRSSLGLIYPCCQKYAAHVISMQSQPWMCPRCKGVYDGYQMCRIIATINGDDNV